MELEEITHPSEIDTRTQARGGAVGSQRSEHNGEASRYDVEQRFASIDRLHPVQECDRILCTHIRSLHHAFEDGTSKLGKGALRILI